MQVTARSKNPIPMTCNVFRVTESQTRTCGGNCYKTNTENISSNSDGKNPPGLKKYNASEKKNHNWEYDNYQNFFRITHVGTDTLQMVCWLLCLGKYLGLTIQSVQHFRSHWSQFVHWSSWPLRYSAWTESCWWLCHMGLTGRPRNNWNCTNWDNSGKRKK